VAVLPSLPPPGEGGGGGHEPLDEGSHGRYAGLCKSDDRGSNPDEMSDSAFTEAITASSSTSRSSF
jgi:hypothetical protein